MYPINYLSDDPNVKKDLEDLNYTKNPIASNRFDLADPLDGRTKDEEVYNPNNEVPS